MLNQASAGMSICQCSHAAYQLCAKTCGCPRPTPLFGWMHCPTSLIWVPTIFFFQYCFNLLPIYIDTSWVPWATAPSGPNPARHCYVPSHVRSTYSYYVRNWSMLACKKYLILPWPCLWSHQAVCWGLNSTFGKTSSSNRDLQMG